jgi:hypothetical protein
MAPFFDDTITTSTRELRRHVVDDLEALGDVLELFGDIFAELPQLAAALRTAIAAPEHAL